MGRSKDRHQQQGHCAFTRLTPKGAAAHASVRLWLVGSVRGYSAERIRARMEPAGRRSCWAVPGMQCPSQ